MWTPPPPRIPRWRKAASLRSSKSLWYRGEPRVNPLALALTLALAPTLTVTLTLSQPYRYP